MIVRPRPTTWQLMFVLRGSIIPLVFRRILVVALVSCAAVWVDSRFHVGLTHLSAVPFSLFGLALSVFLSFRNNVCYERWWTARKHWGTLVIHARALTREALANLANTPVGDETASRLARQTIAFAHALVARLRERPAELSAWLEPASAAALARRRNVPDAVLAAMQRTLRAGLNAGALDPIVYQGMTTHLTGLGEVQAACERIKFTPVPFAYTLLLHRTAWLFCLMLPFGLVGLLGALTPLVVIGVAYTVFGLDALGDELEDPFGLAENDLPLDALARGLEIDLLEQLGMTPLPEPMQPRDYLLT